jgi:hypothetical protein
LPIYWWLPPGPEPEPDYSGLAVRLWQRITIQQILWGYSIT